MSSDTALQVIYDMQMNPASYDVLPFLSVADKHRSQKGLPHMDVHFMPGEHTRFYDAYYPKGESEREGLLWRVCVAACRLVKSVRNVHVYNVRQGVGGEFKYPESWATSRPDLTHGGDLLINANKCFSASAQAKAWVDARYKNYMTITLRECDYGTDRNSDRVEWWRLARTIKNAGANIVIVPDTYGKTLKDFENCLPASWDIDIRLALYEGAIINMGVANGPMSLCVLSKSRFAMLNTHMQELAVDGNIVRPNVPPSDLLPWIEPYLRAAA